MTRKQEIQRHYSRFFGTALSAYRWPQGPIDEIGDDFHVLEFRPSTQHDYWKYATLCMSRTTDSKPLELHLLSPDRRDEHVELLTMAAHYHRTGARLGWGHTVNFGYPWGPGSLCSFGLICLPFPYGPDLERLVIDGSCIECLWLLPITELERKFKIENGLEALEQRFDAVGFDILDYKRPSVI